MQQVARGAKGEMMMKIVQFSIIFHLLTPRVCVEGGGIVKYETMKNMFHILMVNKTHGKHWCEM